VMQSKSLLVVFFRGGQEILNMREVEISHFCDDGYCRSSAEPGAEFCAYLFADSREWMGVDELRPFSVGSVAREQRSLLWFKSGETRTLPTVGVPIRPFLVFCRVVVDFVTQVDGKPKKR
jgi:hypothetical protein